MKRDMLRFFPVLILILVACNLSNAGMTPTPVSTLMPIMVSSPEITLAPIPGDLGFGNVTGTVTDSDTGFPIPNATVTCEHYSYTSKESDRCNRTTTTDETESSFSKKYFSTILTISSCL